MFKSRELRVRQSTCGSYLPTPKSSDRKRVHSVLSESGNHRRLIKSANPKESIATIKEKSFLGMGMYGIVKLLNVDSNNPSSFQAVKIKKTDLTDDSEEKFHEYIRQKNLQHRVIVPERTLYEPATKLVYQIMPLVNFGDGNALINAFSPLNKQDKQLIKRHLMIQLIDIYFQLWENGIFHLDLKPDNILLDDEGNCYLIDFDLSIILDSLGEYYRKPEPLAFDLKFAPQNFPELPLDKPSNRHRVYGGLDAYRLGLTCLLIYKEIIHSHAEFLNLRQLKPLVLKKLLEDSEVPEELAVIIKGFLKEDINERMTINEAKQIMQNFALSEEEKRTVQSLFSQLSQTNSDSEKSAERPQKRPRLMLENGAPQQTYSIFRSGYQQTVTRKDSNRESEKIKGEESEDLNPTPIKWAGYQTAQASLSIDSQQQAAPSQEKQGHLAFQI